MPGIFPNPSAAAENFSVGDQVRWFVNEREISPYIGVVTQICPSINKLWVEFPIGGNQQKDPTELILVTKFMGEAPIAEDTGYSSYDKAKSDETYGRIDKKVIDLARKLIQKKAFVDDSEEGRERQRIRKQEQERAQQEQRKKEKHRRGDSPEWSYSEGLEPKPFAVREASERIAKNFATDVVEKLSTDVQDCLSKGMTDIYAYQTLYPKYEKICSESFFRGAISRMYKGSSDLSTK